MYTLDQIKDIGQTVLTQFESLPKLISYKSTIQTELTNCLTQSETIQVAVTDKPSQSVFEKLIGICRVKYNSSPSDKNLYLIAFSAAAIIKDYNWGDESVLLPETLTNIVNMIVDTNSVCSIYQI